MTLEEADKLLSTYESALQQMHWAHCLVHSSDMEDRWKAYANEQRAKILDLLVMVKE